MGTTKAWLKGQLFARSIERSIDRNTLIDLMGIVIYEADRSILLDNAGFTDTTPAVDCLFDYVLDALGIPGSNAAFSREPFNQIFYNDYWLEKQYGSLDEVLVALETLRDEMAERIAKATAIRAGISLVKPEKPEVD